MNKTDEQTRIDNLKAIKKLQELHTLLIQAQQIKRGLNDFKVNAIRSYPSDSIFVEMIEQSQETFNHVLEMVQDDLNDLKEERKKAA